MTGSLWTDPDATPPVLSAAPGVPGRRRGPGGPGEPRRPAGWSGARGGGATGRRSPLWPWR